MSKRPALVQEVCPLSDADAGPHRAPKAPRVQVSVCIIGGSCGEANGEPPAEAPAEAEELLDIDARCALFADFQELLMEDGRRLGARHGAARQEFGQKNVPCQFCAQTFSVRSALKKHAGTVSVRRGWDGIEAQHLPRCKYFLRTAELRDQRLSASEDARRARMLAMSNAQLVEVLLDVHRRIDRLEARLPVCGASAPPRA